MARISRAVSRPVLSVTLSAPVSLKRLRSVHIGLANYGCAFYFCELIARAVTATALC
jgi:hypothetical protein